MSRTFKWVTIVAIIAVLGFSIPAFAGWGRGPGYGCGGRGGVPADCPRGYGAGYYDDERYQKYSKEREAFFNETESVRRGIHEKESALRNELAKDNPDPQIAAGLQKEISDLESQLNQKRLDHQLRMKKADPDYVPGGRGYGRGMGYGYGRQGGGGYCWR